MGLITIMIIVLFLIIIYIPIPYVITKMMRRQFLNTLRMSGCVYLTFDDGPHPEATPKILELLEKAGVRATFFLLGENVEKHRDIVAKIVSQGHEIGSHGYSHLHPWKSNPYHSLLDLIRGDKIIKQCKTPESTSYFRPPYGKFNLITLLYVLITKKKVVFWNVDPKDYKETLGERVALSVMRTIHPGSIVLLHDGRQEITMSQSQITVYAVELILDFSQKNGLLLKKIGESAIKTKIRI